MSDFVGGLLGLHALTPLHPGAGTALGVVDLPVQRERHTQWPTIPGTALKGVLRDAFKRKKKSSDVTMLFGGEPGGRTEAEIIAGALSIGDARLFAFPVRSLKGVWAWVTCPAVLSRFARDASLVGLDAPDVSAFRPPEGEAIVTGGDLLVPIGGVDKVVLEEFDAKATKSTLLERFATEFAKLQLPDGEAYKQTRERFVSSLCVLHDDDFGHFVRYATEVVARIGLDHETKTVKGGALFYQELLPAETLFYSVILAEGSRHKASKADATEVLKRFGGSIPGVIQVGADETTGRGFCATQLRRKGGA